MWFAVLFPTFLLDRLREEWFDRDPWVIADRIGRHTVVIQVSQAAERVGIQPGMSIPAARALYGRLHVMPREPVSESEALFGLALSALQFTPRVVIDQGSTNVSPILLLELAGSVLYFGGWSSLALQVQQHFEWQGYNITYGAAPTPIAAVVCARSGITTPVETVEELPGKLYPLLLSSLTLPEVMREQLQCIGVKTIGELEELPRSGVIHRWGGEVLVLLDRMMGRILDNRLSVVIPTQFLRRVQCSWEVEQMEPLQRMGERLIGELIGFLHHHQLAVQRPIFHLECRHGSIVSEHDDKLLHPKLIHQKTDDKESIPLLLARPTADRNLLIRLWRERLTRLKLCKPVVAIALEADGLVPSDETPLDLFQGPQATEEFAWLIARLRARWGEHAVRGVAIADDHRPERAWQWVEPGIYSGKMDESSGKKPLWLLKQPIAVPENGPGRLSKSWEPMSSVERIETGWWDDPIARDYVVLRREDGGRWWAFRDRKSNLWYLHGGFG